MNFESRIAAIERAEAEFRDKLKGLVAPNSPIAVSDLFAMGAARRFLALSSGFRTLAKERNFPSCAGLLRMQIDNAARMNALWIVPNMFEFCEALMKGERFDRLKDRDGKPLKDGHLITVLSAEHPWVTDVYRTTSGDIHLSVNVLYSGLTKVDDDGQFEIYIGADNPTNSDEDYFPLLDAFYRADQMSGGLVLGYFTLRSEALTAPHDT